MTRTRSPSGRTALTAGSDVVFHATFAERKRAWPGQKASLGPLTLAQSLAIIISQCADAYHNALAMWVTSHSEPGCDLLYCTVVPFVYI